VGSFYADAYFLTELLATKITIFSSITKKIDSYKQDKGFIEFQKEITIKN
tara:strand:- start:1522 stop:1671 length:150 start_codon:yes stop_codon:yes gene_type:complete